MVRATPSIRTALRPVVRARVPRAQNQVRFRTTENTDSARENGPVKEFNKTGNTNKPWLYVSPFPLHSAPATTYQLSCLPQVPFPLKSTMQLILTDCYEIASPVSPPSPSAASTPR